MKLKSNEFTATDPQAINDLLRKMPELGRQGLKVLEPAAGVGTLADRYEKLTKNKIDKYDIVSRREDIIEQDYIKLNCKNQYDLIITNFPYQMANGTNPIGYSQLLKKALIDVRPGGYVANFQRLAQLESKQRYEDIYGKYKPYKIFVYSKRINCYNNGDFNQKVQGSIAYSWVVWKKDEQGYFMNKTELDWIY